MTCTETSAQVNSLNNILIIGMTNRMDMIDEALLRPGRLEVHMEIPLPDEKGRFEIFKIHTAGMAKHNRLTTDVDLEELARLTKNFSGAEILGLTKSAQSFAMNRCLDPTNPTKVIKPEEAIVSQHDFLNALGEVKPAFGVVGEEFTNLAGNGIVDYGPSYQKLNRAGQLFMQQVKTSSSTRHVSILLEGKSGTGKSALATSFALNGGFPFVKLVSPENLVGFSESAKCSKIQSVRHCYHNKQHTVLRVCCFLPL
jgi:vesicle-fusing ATPase